MQSSVAESAEYLDRWIHENRVSPHEVERLVQGLTAPAPERTEGPREQQPVILVPGLTARPFWDPDEFSWSAALRASTPDIVREFALLQEASRQRASSAQSDLADQGRWSALYLYYAGRRYRDNVSACPATAAALAASSVATLGDGGMTYFSMMAPHSHVAAHHGYINAHLRAHLGLEVPGGCRIRVGNQSRTWGLGELLVFDDSFEHEVWNDSDRRRVVLLFDMWHPDLTAVERAALTHLSTVWRRLQARQALSAEVVGA